MREVGAADAWPRMRAMHTISRPSRIASDTVSPVLLRRSAMTGSAAALSSRGSSASWPSSNSRSPRWMTLPVALEVSLAHERGHEARDRGFRQVGTRRELRDAKPVVVFVERLEDRGHAVEDADRVWFGGGTHRAQATCSASRCVSASAACRTSGAIRFGSMSTAGPGHGDGGDRAALRGEDRAGDADHAGERLASVDRDGAGAHARRAPARACGGHRGRAPS